MPDGELSSTGETTQSLNKPGLTVQTLTPDLAKQFGLQNEKGVLLTLISFPQRDIHVNTPEPVEFKLIAGENKEIKE